MIRRISVFSLIPLFAIASSVAAGPLELKKGDHICFIGNTLAERMQHYGWLETLIHARFPQHELVFRNLGYSGDEVDGWQNPTHRMRSMSFGSQDEWLAGSAPCPQPTKLSPRDKGKVRENRFELTNTRADVILAFYGYNESFEGEAGLARFRENLDAFIKHTLSQKYNGKSAPQLVLISPIAHEKLPDPNLPPASEIDATNARLKLYTGAMLDVAKGNNIVCVDLFSASQKLYASRASQQPATINGIHLNRLGDEQIGEIIAHHLFGAQAGPADGAKLKQINAAVNDKNWYWFHRYRVTDGYSTYGDRAFLKFSEGPGGYGDGLSNYSVGQRELDVIDELTSNRDSVVWAAAQGKKVAPDDSKLSEFIPVISNKPGPLPGGKHIFLGGGEESISKMTVHKGMKVELFASEEQFPELINPVQMAFDTKGRLWVAAWPTYPHWKPTEPMNDKLLILEDTNGDGKADRCITFAGDIHNPTGFEFWGGGVLVAQGPDVLFLKDTNGDDKYDIKERVLHGLDTADTHHTANSFTLDPGGALYFQEGTFHHTQVESPWGPARRVANGAVFRYEPRAQKFDVYVSHGFANPHGHAFDHWGQDIVVDGTGSNPYHAALFSGHINFPDKHNTPPSVYKQRTRPCPAIEYISSSHFPEEMRGNLLVGNVITHHGILQYKVHDQDSSFGATELDPIVISSDPNFRPADMEIAPDGSLYFTDWQNPIIGHMQHNLRDPSRDRLHGRVYRVTAEGRPLVKHVPIAGQPVEQLVSLLSATDDRLRYRARIELSGRGTEEVIGAVNRWVANLSKSDKNIEHHLLEALWVHQHHNVVNTNLLERLLTSPEYRARAAAVRVLCYWRDRVSNTLDLVKRAAADQAPRVRLEAVRTASFLPQAEAIEVVLIAAELPNDQYLDFLSKETMRTLQPLYDQAKRENRQIAFTTDAGARFYLRNLSNDQLLKEPRNKTVYLELLYRPGLRDEVRRDAVRGLAKIDNKPELQIVMDAIRALDARQANADPTVIFDLVRQLTSRSAAELNSARAELEKLATTARQPIFRQIGFVSLINVDGSVDKAWALASRDVKMLQDFVSAMPLISDASVRATLYEKLEPLLNGLPPQLATPQSKGTTGRFVRIELPGKATLTLAEVEVYSGADNVARRGRATQKSTAHGGDASKAIDGNKKGEFGAGGQTHTQENGDNPFWEVDLGEEYPINRIVIFNRTDGDIGNRLANYTLQVLDEKRQEVFKLEKNPAPKVQAEVALSGGGSDALIRRAAMLALTYVRGQEAKTFQTLARFVRDDVDRIAAVRAMQRLPRASWPAEDAPPLVSILTDFVRKTPTQDRTAPAALDALEFADSLAGLLAPDAAKKARLELSELGVRVIKIGTIFEKMSYDKDVVAVKAGKPVEFILDNSDLMPHNFVITEPGALEEVGLLSEANAQQPGFAERHFVPQSNKILTSSVILQPRGMQKLSFTAPKQPGVYPFVCTYPGHWRRMYGALYVVEDLDEYQANPEAYLAAAKIEAKDALLKDRRPRTEWTFDDLAGSVEEMTKNRGRSYGNGKQLFSVASCVGCHKLDGVGREFAPDLTKLDAKLTSIDILNELLDPSKKINEKYQTNVIELGSGKVITGLVLEETPDVLKIIENPLAKAEPIIVKRGEVVERQKSKLSLMPKGLLDKLTRDEILDLVAYVSARGNKQHSLFQGGHDHDHEGH